MPFFIPASLCIVKVSVKRNNAVHVFGLTENGNNDGDDSHWLYAMTRKKQGLAQVPRYFELAATRD